MDISLTNLSVITGQSVSHLSQLQRRGILPKGYKKGRERMVPKELCLELLKNHQPHKHWAGELSEANPATVKPEPNWAALI